MVPWFHSPASLSLPYFKPTTTTISFLSCSSQIVFLLKHRADLPEGFWELFQQLRDLPLPIATSSESTEMDSSSQNPLDQNGKRINFQACEENETGSDRKEEEESVVPIGAQNILLMPTGEKVVVWTRSEPKPHQIR